MDWLPKSNMYPGVGHHNILGEKEHKKFWIDSRFWYIIYYLDPSLATLFHESGQAPNNRVFGQYEVAQDQTHSSKDRMNSDDEVSKFLLLMYKVFIEYMSIRLRLTNEELIKAKKEINRLKRESAYQA